MPAVFARKAGTVIAVSASEEGTPPQAGVIRVEGEGGDLKATGDIVITGFSSPSSVAYKATSTIGGPKYLTVFGDNLTQITINTVLFQGDGCDQELNGILSGFQFYADNRLKPDSTPIVKIVYGGVSFEGFLVGYTPSSQINSGLQVHSGQFTIIGWVSDDWFTRTASTVEDGEGESPDLINTTTGRSDDSLLYTTQIQTGGVRQ